MSGGQKQFAILAGIMSALLLAARVQIGTAKGAKSVLHHLAQSQDQRKTASPRTLRPARIPICG
jgi:hypothetical protein